MKRLIALAAVLTVTLVAACTQPQAPEQNPYPPVPPLVSDIQPKPPITAEPLMWQPGHWDWTGSAYTWAKGQYVPAAGHGSLWMPGWWSRTQTGWEWIPPHWMS
jgi:hypothetical protein